MLFTDGLKTEAEIQSALNALDELLKQIAEQQSVLAAAQTNVNNNFASLLVGPGGTSADFRSGWCKFCPRGRSRISGICCGIDD